MKGAATARLLQDGLHPLADRRTPDGNIPSPWERECGHKFLVTDRDMLRAIDYVERNPLKDGMRSQRWSFVTAYQSAAVESPFRGAPEGPRVDGRNVPPNRICI